jgi:hypothetical protein
VQNRYDNSAAVYQHALTRLRSAMARCYSLRFTTILCALCAFASLVLLPQHATAQYNSGIRGEVNDTSGLAVVGATVTAKNTATGETKTIQF